MRASGIRYRPLVVLSCLLLSIPLLSAQDQDQRPAANREGFQSHCTSQKLEQKWLDEDALWIITDQEPADCNKLTTNDQRDEFVGAFWERRNPTPQSSENPYKEEHYRASPTRTLTSLLAIPDIGQTAAVSTSCTDRQT
jgi:hypothetical protein